jgi:two-component system response regulator FixJ
MTSRRPIPTQGEKSEKECSGPIVFVVDDDAGMRSVLRRLLTLANLPVELYASGTEFLSAASFNRPGCVILDVSMPQMSGLEVQANLKLRRVELPVVFLTGSSDIPVAVAAMREGAVDFIEKPFDNKDLVARIRSAIEHSESRRRQREARSAILGRLERLTPREREVMEQVVAGRTSKEIARIVGASHRTVEIHRARLMEKMEAATLADLVRMHLRLQGDAQSES